MTSLSLRRKSTDVVSRLTSGEKSTHSPQRKVWRVTLQEAAQRASTVALQNVRSGFCSGSNSRLHGHSGTVTVNRGESSEAAMSRHTTAEKLTQREFHKIFQLLSAKGDFEQLDTQLKLYHLNRAEFCSLKPLWLRYQMLYQIT